MKLFEYWIGFIWWYLLPIRKKVAVQNYQRCFPSRNPRELRRSVGEIASQYLEIWMGKRALLQHPPSLKEGGICLAGHGAGWDIALISLGSVVPVTIFVRDLPDSFLYRWISKIRRQNNIEELKGSNSLQRGYQALKEGRLLIFVQDQRYNKGLATMFFKHMCYTSPAFAAAVLKTQAPVYGAWQKKENGRHIATIERLTVHPNGVAKKTIQDLTQQSQEFYQSKIRENPYAWLWLHKRWKNVD